MDAWAPLRTRKGVHHQVGRAHQPGLHRGRRLDRQPCLHQWGIETTATRGEHFRQHNMLLGAIPLDRAEPTGIHHRHVGP